MSYLKRLEVLDVEIQNAYTKLRKQREHINIINWEDNYFDIRNEHTGGTFEVTIEHINSNGIFVHYVDDDKSKYVGFNDLSSSNDKASLVDLMIESIS